MPSGAGFGDSGVAGIAQTTSASQLDRDNRLDLVPSDDVVDVVLVVPILVG